MKILVTGGTGLVGAAAVRELVKAGHVVRLLSRHAERDAAAFAGRVEAFATDLGAGDQLDEAVRGSDAVLHAAGILNEEPPDITYQKVNVGGTGNLLETATRNGQPFVLYVSSLGADRGASEYHRSKLCAERLVQSYGGSWLIVRPGNVYGPGDETVSTLLKMVRALPAVPMVGRGDQRFQPAWHEDVGELLAQAIVERTFKRQVIELAGPEVTTTSDLLNRIETLTARAPKRIPVPLAVAQAGAKLLEAIGAAELLKKANLEAPIDATKLHLLAEESVIADASKNALLNGTFAVRPTPLDDGLAMLADLLPEQAPGEGVGTVTRAVYWADIIEPALAPVELLRWFREHLAEVMPLDFVAEPGAPAQPEEEGDTMTGALPGRGNFQVRLEHETEREMTFVTIEGHPLAGMLTFATDAIEGGVRFAVRIVSQPANAADLVAMRTVGTLAQETNWRRVVRRVVEASGGESPKGVQKRRETLSDEEANDFRERARGLVQRRQREEREREVRAERE